MPLLPVREQRKPEVVDWRENLKLSRAYFWNSVAGGVQIRYSRIHLEKFAVHELLARIGYRRWLLQKKKEEDVMIRCTNWICTARIIDIFTLEFNRSTNGVEGWGGLILKRQFVAWRIRWAVERSPFVIQESRLSAGEIVNRELSVELPLDVLVELAWLRVTDALVDPHWNHAIG